MMNNVSSIIKDHVKQNEDYLVELFSSKTMFSVGETAVTRYTDDLLPDAYCHNFSVLDQEPTNAMMGKLIQIKRQRGEFHLQIDLNEPSSFLTEVGYDESTTLTMVKEDYLNFDISREAPYRYASLKEERRFGDAIVELDVAYYGEEYGEDFVRRRWKRKLKKFDEGDNGTNYFFVLDGDKVIAICDACFAFGVVGVDGLLVEEAYRHQYVASNLLKFIAFYYQCPIYLHADDEETPKEIYAKLGFVTVSKGYEYLKLDNPLARGKLELVQLSQKYKSALFDMMDEWRKMAPDDRNPSAIFKHDYHDFDRYIESLNIKEPRPGKVPGTTFFALEKEQGIFVGAINIRHYLNEGLLLGGGHIGDGIRPSQRRKGYATEMICLGLEECKKLGIRRVLMTCDKDNIGSRKSIMNNGGVLENEIEYEGELLQRYWIDLE